MDQIKNLSPKLFELGCRAVLKEMGFAKDHPMYKDRPKFTPTVFAPASTLADALPVVPTEVRPPPETPGNAVLDATPSSAVPPIRDAGAEARDADAGAP